MDRMILIRTVEELAQWSKGTLLPPLSAADFVQHTPDAHWTLADARGEGRARCSLWWRHVPSLPGDRLGILGHYAACDSIAARRVLRHACEQLAAQGCTLAVGPMDGNTWRTYRLLVERGSEPVFYLEPDNPDDWPAHFLESGFTALAHYTSGLNTDLSRQDPRVEEVACRIAARGIRIRALAPERMEDDLRRIYAVARVSFQRNFLYTPIDESEFLSQYRPILSRFRPELVLIAEQADRVVGFLFALPALLQGRRGEVIDTVILKTVGVLPERCTAGLGGLLIARAHEAARSLGYVRAIHALMHEGNVSRNISQRYARTFRRYTLFARRLERAA